MEIETATERIVHVLNESTSERQLTDALYRLAQALKTEGLSQGEMEQVLHGVYQEDTTLCDAQNGALITILDCIVGYCSPHAKLFPEVSDLPLSDT